MENRLSLSISNQGDLEYIKIDHKNKIVELSCENHIIEANSFLNSLAFAEENIGGEINKFFLNVLPENKEGEALKVITAIAQKAKIEKDILNNCLTNILNRPEGEKIILNRDLSEEISTILKEKLKKKKKKLKLKNYGEIKKLTQNYLDNASKEDILSMFKIDSRAKSLSDKQNNLDNSNNYNLNNKIKNTKKEDIPIYEYKDIKTTKETPIPIEMIILLRKFSMSKTLRLTINSDYYTNNMEISKTNDPTGANNINDLENNILILLNLDWLFPNLVELELDLSNINLIETQINIYKYSLDIFSKIIDREVKMTNYSIKNHNAKRINESLNKSTNAQSSWFDDDENIIDKSIKTYQIFIKQDFDEKEITYSDEKYHKKFKNFIKAYTNLMEMMIIYGYFIGKMETIIKTKFIMPINIGDEIYYLLKNKNIFINDFHILSFITKKNIIDLNIEFNSLDSQSFEKVFSFINQNSNLSILNLSFFPPEELFKTELLFKLLQISDENFKLKKYKVKDNKLSFNPYIIYDIKANEDLDVFILRKLSDNFEKNMQNLFYIFTLKTNIIELSMNFDMPTLLIKNGIYNNILMKFFVNLFILIDSPLNNNIRKLSLICENFIFDGRKYPILNDFCDKLNLNKNKNHKMTSLTFLAKIYKVPKIYLFIPYNLNYLSIGSLDYETFDNLVDYLTSSEFGIRTKLLKLTIHLNNSLIEANQGKLIDILTRLFTEYPKGLKEINLYSFLIFDSEQLHNLLMKTNYNTLPNIFLQISYKSITGEKAFEGRPDNSLSDEYKNIFFKMDNLVDLYTIKRDEKITNDIISLMSNLSRINKDILSYNIFSNIERYLCSIEKKKITIQFT